MGFGADILPGNLPRSLSLVLWQHQCAKSASGWALGSTSSLLGARRVYHSPRKSQVVVPKGEKESSREGRLILQVSQYHPRVQRERVILWDLVSLWQVTVLEEVSPGLWHRVPKECDGRSTGWGSPGLGVELYRLQWVQTEKQPLHPQRILYLLIFKAQVRSSLISFDWNIIQVKIAFHGSGDTLQNLTPCLKCECLIYL